MVAQGAEKVRIDVKQKDLRVGDRLIMGPNGRTGLVKGCWNGGAAIEDLYYSLIWSEYEVLTVLRHIDGSTCADS